jgi:hypothetical protein
VNGTRESLWEAWSSLDRLPRYPLRDLTDVAVLAAHPDDDEAAHHDAVLGPVEVHDWSTRSRECARRYALHAEQEAEQQRVHGANLGVRADAYERVGGFPALAGRRARRPRGGPTRLHDFPAWVRGSRLGEGA